jgi:hypothetical protein
MTALARSANFAGGAAESACAGHAGSGEKQQSEPLQRDCASFPLSPNGVQPSISRPRDQLAMRYRWTLTEGLVAWPTKV